MRFHRFHMRCGSPDRARPAPAARAASVWLTSAALLLGACGGGSTGDADDADPGQTSRAEAPAETEGTAVDETAATAEAEAPGDGEPESLSDYLGFDLEDPDAAAAQFQESERRAQELMALCMGREGFEYVPFTSTAGLQADFQDDSEEYAREYGFGITTWYGREEPDDGGVRDGPEPGHPGRHVGIRTGSLFRRPLRSAHDRRRGGRGLRGRADLRRRLPGRGLPGGAGPDDEVDADARAGDPGYERADAGRPTGGGSPPRAGPRAWRIGDTGTRTRTRCSRRSLPTSGAASTR